MPISFDSIPQTAVPGVYAEISNRNAFNGLNRFNKRLVVIGQKLSTGSATTNTIEQITSVDQAVRLYGRGSMLHNMFIAVQRNQQSVEVHGIALDDNAAGTIASGTVTVTGIAVEAGTINLYVAGVRVQAPVANGDSATTVASAIVTAINANADLPATASNTAGVVTVTSRHKGDVGNELTLYLNWLGELGYERTPTGLAIALVQPSGGGSNPSLTTLIANLPELLYDYFVMPYVDTTSLTNFHDELVRRWGGTSMTDGLMISARRGNFTSQNTFLSSQNKQFFTYENFNASPTPAYEWAVSYALQIAGSAAEDEARPLHTLPLKGVKPPKPTDLYKFMETDLLLKAGGATFAVDNDGQVRIQRAVTTYTQSISGQPDISYQNVERLNTLSYIRQDSRAFLYKDYIEPRFKLANDGTKANLGQLVVTPSDVRLALIGRAKQWEADGKIENAQAFEAGLIVERDTTDPNRLNVKMTPDLINQLQVVGLQIEFLV
jgi:phage tail sheath gpL-like